MTDDAALPTEYAETFRAIRDRVTATRSRVQLAANAHLIHLYWSIGSVLLERSKAGRWGSGVLRQLAEDLRAEFPSMTGLSPRNLKYRRQFAAAWPEEASIGPQRVDRLPWGHIRALLPESDPVRRKRYAEAAVEHGWSRNVLVHNLRSRALERSGAQTTNFSRLLDGDDADLAQQITRDPYVLDFLAVDGDRDERAIESAMVDRIAETLREFGVGFAFVGRQVHFDVDGSDFFVDRLFCAASSTPKPSGSCWWPARTMRSSGTRSESPTLRSGSPRTTSCPRSSSRHCRAKRSCSVRCSARPERHLVRRAAGQPYVGYCGHPSGLSSQSC
ncbi:PDDEXK nuclease domain-containing protein [Curtobacterium flaccumfaciens]|uniref:PDDEXK nuclease domain-containing protein n=1 Tax=Curtobacterium flaccumfaciens TaxID=2035 RepID=UPI003F7E3E3A